MNPGTRLAGTAGAASIMVTSVMERRSETGLRHALGAPNGPPPHRASRSTVPRREPQVNPTGSPYPGYDQPRCVATPGEHPDDAYSGRTTHLSPTLRSSRAGLKRGSWRSYQPVRCHRDRPARRSSSTSASSTVRPRLSGFRMGGSITLAMADPRRHRPGAEHMKLHGVVRSGRQEVGWVQAEHSVSSARASLSSETLRDRCRARCRAQSGSASRSEPGRPARRLLASVSLGPAVTRRACPRSPCLADHREPLVVHSIVGPDSRKPAAMLAIPMA
jgi:hypothetical protein